jgi:hypothetical protein
MCEGRRDAYGTHTLRASEASDAAQEGSDLVLVAGEFFGVD